MIRILTAAILTAATAPAAGCRSSSPHSAAPRSSAFTLAKLAQHPCIPLTAKEKGQFHIVTGGTEAAADIYESCNWKTSDGSQLSFTPYPSADATENAASQPTARRFQIGNHRAVSAASALGPEVACYLGVALGENRSFIVSADPWATRDVNTCKVCTSFATTILRYVR